MKLLRAAFFVSALVAATGACSGPSGNATPSARAAGTGPVGAWQVTITEADFRAAGVTEAGALEENAGTFTWTVLADGTFTEAQRSDHPVKWPVFKGTWSETGAGVVELRTTFPADFAGETIVVGWERRGDALHLRLIEPQDPALRVHFESHPWLPAP